MASSMVSLTARWIKLDTCPTGRTMLFFYYGLPRKRTSHCTSVSLDWNICRLQCGDGGRCPVEDITMLEWVALLLLALSMPFDRWVLSTRAAHSNAYYISVSMSRLGQVELKWIDGCSILSSLYLLLWWQHKALHGQISGPRDSDIDPWTPQDAYSRVMWHRYGSSMQHTMFPATK